MASRKTASRVGESVRRTPECYFRDQSLTSPSMPAATLDTIANLAKKRGFVFQSSEIYGGLRSAYDYGPLGTELLRNVKDEWWRSMVRERDNIVGLDSAIMQARQVWVASGHEARLVSAGSG